MCTIRLKFLHTLDIVCILHVRVVRARARARARVRARARARVSYIEILLCSSFKIERNLEFIN